MAGGSDGVLVLASSMARIVLKLHVTGLSADRIAQDYLALRLPRARELAYSSSS
jgi:hypothetical protein